MKQIVAIIALAAASLLPSSGSAQTTAACNREDPKCLNLGGKCYTVAETSVCPEGFIKDKDLCGTGDKCFCCKPAKCDQTTLCTSKNGKCMARESCSENNGVVIPDACKQPSISQDCICCAPPPPPCEQTDECKIDGGECMDKQKCMSNPNMIWDTTLCKNSAATEPTCGCCKQKPAPCETSRKCKAEDGKCTSEEVCKNKEGYEWHKDLCPSNNPDCGCCHKIKKTKAPTQACTLTDQCSEKGGKCISRERCAKMKDMVWISQLCSPDMNSVNPRCGCCMKKTKAPTTSCSLTEECRKAEGECMSRDKCDKIKNSLWQPQLCENSPSGKPKCGCCTKPPPQCKKTDPKCSDASGFCRQKDEGCPQNFIVDYSLCGEVLDDAGADTCYCCKAGCKTKDDACKKKRDGKCVQKREDCPATKTFDETLCRKDSNSNLTCGCCYTAPTCNLQDEVCTMKKGFCLPASAKGQCNLETHEWAPSLCGTSDECACCYPKA